MNRERIYVAVESGGEYDDKWSTPQAASDDKAKVEQFIENQKACFVREQNAAKMLAEFTAGLVKKHPDVHFPQARARKSCNWEQYITPVMRAERKLLKERNKAVTIANKQIVADWHAADPATRGPGPAILKRVKIEPWSFESLPADAKALLQADYDADKITEAAELKERAEYQDKVFARIELFKTEQYKFLVEHGLQGLVDETRLGYSHYWIPEETRWDIDEVLKL